MGITAKPFFGYLAERRISIKKCSDTTGISNNSLTNFKKTGFISRNLLDVICRTYGLKIEEVVRFDR